MGKRDLFWDSVPTNDEGHLLWPADPDARTHMAGQVLGARLVGALDSILDDEVAAAEGRLPAPGSHNYEAEAKFRSVFATLSPQQREAVVRLVKRASSGTLYWALVKLDNFIGGNLDIVVHPWGPDGEPMASCVVNQDELHHMYFDWIEQFSDHIVEGDDAAQQRDEADEAR